MGVTRSYWPLVVTGLLVWGAAILGRQQTSPQITAGRTLYQTNCAGCHMPDLGGRNEAPPLAGANFMSTWGARSTRDLLGTIQTTMPRTRGKSQPNRIP